MESCMKFLRPQIAFGVVAATANTTEDGSDCFSIHVCVTNTKMHATEGDSRELSHALAFHFHFGANYPFITHIFIIEDKLQIHNCNVLIYSSIYICSFNCQEKYL